MTISGRSRFALLSLASLASLASLVTVACSSPTAPSDGAITDGGTSGSMDGSSDGASAMDGGAQSPLDQAFGTGAVGTVTERQLCDALRGDIAAARASRFAIWSALYGTGPMGEVGADTITNFSWDPTHDSMVLTSVDDSRNVPVIMANAMQSMGEPKRSPLAFAGVVGAWKYLALGTNGLANFGANAPMAASPESRMEQVFVRAVRWLTGNNAPNGAGMKVVTAHLADSFYFRHDSGTRAFFTRNFSGATLNADDACESANLAACLDGASLLVIGAEDGTDDDNSHVPLDLTAIEGALALAQSRGIPVLYAPHYREENSVNALVHKALRVTVSNNYWDIQRLTNATPADLTARPLPLDTIATAVDTVCNNALVLADYESCLPNPDSRATTLNSCTAAPFRQKIMDGANLLRAAVNALDAQAINPFSADGYRVIRGAILLGDVLRSGAEGTAPLRYPIDWRTTGTSLARAAFSDSTLHLAHPTNRAIADMGTYACTRADVLRAACRPYDPAMVPTSNASISSAFLQGDEWVSTGRYALAGRPFHLRRTDSAPGRVFARVGFAREGTTRAFERSSDGTNYSRPQHLVSAWIELKKDRDIELSSPLGGPIYLRLVGSDALQGTPVTVETTGTAAHPALLEVTPQSAMNFVRDVQASALPHVDLRLTGFEIHLRRDRFLATVTGSTEIARRPSGALSIPYNSDVALALDHIQNHFVGSVYALAGFAAPGSTLDATLSTDVRAICQTLGWACADAMIHRRSTVQHANYDEYANCGYGCSGNPFDAAWSIIPLGWGESHELGHNLQINQLNVHYTSAADRANWARWSNRAGENSNNIFPYHTLWRFVRRVQNDSTTVTDGHMNWKTLFAASQSARANVTSTVMGAQRRVIFDEGCNVMADAPMSTSGADLLPEAIWGDGAYAADNGVRMAFYMGLPVRLHGAMVQGRPLADGWDIFTLLYAHARLFSVAAKTEASWMAARAQLGFERFAFMGDAQYGGRTVASMPGNDFMLVSLAVITGRDARPYFREHGVRFSDVADAQVQAMVTAGRVTQTLGGAAVVLETDLAPLDMSSAPRVALDGTAVWPRDNWHPSRCVR